MKLNPLHDRIIVKRLEEERKPAGGMRTTVRPVLTAGDTAPDFDLADHRGGRVRLADRKGRWVVLWWYPKASTPG